MLNTKFKSSLLLIALCLTGCATTHNYYVEPKGGSEKTGAATISPYFWHKEAVLNCHSKTAVLSRVDDQQIKYSLFINGNTRTVSVAPGQHNLAIFSTYSNGCGAEEQGGSTSLSTTLKPNTHYKLNADVKDGTIYSWLEDEKGNRVSDIATAPAINSSEGRYVPPLNLSQQSVVKIKNYFTQTFTTMQAAVVRRVDGKDVNYDVFGNSGKHVVLLTPGTHQLAIASSFTTGFTHNPQESLGSITVNLKPGVTYQLKIAPGDGYVQNWLEDSNGNKVTPIVKFPT